MSLVCAHHTVARAWGVVVVPKPSTIQRVNLEALTSASGRVAVFFHDFLCVARA